MATLRGVCQQGRPTLLATRGGRLWLIYYGFVQVSTPPGSGNGQSWLWACYSDDGGMTWSEPAPTDLSTSKPAGGAPASVLRLKDGRIAVAWNPRTQVPPDPEPWQRLGRGTLAVAVSPDEGETWSEPVPVAQASYICYPHLLEPEPGQLLLSTGLLRAREFRTDSIVLRFSAAAVLP